MSDVIALLTGVSNPVKLAWIAWFAWGLVQIGWYRRAHVAAADVPASHGRAPRPQRPPRRQMEPRTAALPFEPESSVANSDPSPAPDNADVNAPASEEPPSA